MFNHSKVSVFGQSKDKDYYPIISGVHNDNKYFNSGNENIFEEIYKRVYLSMKNILENFISVNIKDELYEQDNLLSIATKIYRMKKTNMKYYNSILELLQTNLTSIYRGYLYYVENKDLEGMLKSCREKASILEDMDKLKEYLDKLNSSIILFETESSLKTSATVKEEYIIYIKQYGYPDDNMFDLSKLAEIKSELTKI